MYIYRYITSNVNEKYLPAFNSLPSVGKMVKKSAFLAHIASNMYEMK